MSLEAKQLYEFGPFHLDPVRRLLWRQNQPVPLQPKAFDTLLVLVRHSEQTVSKDDLMKEVWPDTFVEESNLAQNVFALRKTLGESVGEHRYIVTVPGRGYRFAHPVRRVPEASQLICDPVTEEKSAPKPAQAPDRARSRLRLLVGPAVLILLGFAGFLGWRQGHSSPPRRIMLAVLPFQNLSGDPGQDYFVDGLTEEMITKLGRLPPDHLGVIARTSIMRYRQGTQRLDQIGRELSVQYVLEGSFRREGDHLRITAQLIQVKDQSHLWAEDYDCRPEDILRVQDNVAAMVAQQIQLRLAPEKPSTSAIRHLVSAEAHEAYLKGRFFWNQRNEAGFRKAIEYFNSAIAKDPDYAQAYAGLADAYILLAGYGVAPEKDVMPKAKQAALRAAAIDDSLAEPYVSLGLIYQQFEWNWKEAEKSYKHAIALDPNYPVAHHWYGAGYLGAFAGPNEVIAELRQAQMLDPLSPSIATDLATWLCVAGKFDEGVRAFQEILRIDPDFVPAHRYLSEAYERRGMFSEALAELDAAKHLDDPESIWRHGHIYALQGNRQKAHEMIGSLREMSERTYVDPAFVAFVHIALGEKDDAMFWLEKAYDEHSPSMTGLKTTWTYDALRSDPRFADLVRRVGIP